MSCECRSIADIIARMNATNNNKHKETQDKNTSDIVKQSGFLQDQIVELAPDLSPILQKLNDLEKKLNECDLNKILKRLDEVEAFLWTGVKPNG